MASWAIIENDKVVNLIIADSKEIAENITGLEAINDEGWIGVGFEKTPDGWRLPYPEDGLTYTWNDTFKIWDLVIELDDSETNISIQL